MQPRLVRVAAAADEFASLFTAARSAGLRLGWLDLSGEPAPDTELAAAADAGALRAVAVGGGRVVALKTLAGQPVLRDIVREHFTGCRLLLVRGDVEAPRLSAEQGAWRLSASDSVAGSYTTDELLEALRRPSFP